MTLRNFVDPSLSSPDEQSAPLTSDAARLKTMLGKKMGALDEAWFSPLFFSLPQDSTLRIELPHPLFYHWLRLTGGPLLEKTARELLGDNLRIVYGHGSDKISYRGHRTTEPEGVRSAGEREVHGPGFSEFIAGGRNREVLLHFRHSLAGPPCTMLLLGASGSGKSHLLRTAEFELRQSLNDVLFFPCRELVSLFHRSLTMAQEKFMSAKAVIVDDIQLLEKHPDIQHELAALLDGLEGTTFFLASYLTDDLDDGGQKLLPSLYDRLCTHLSLGLADPDLDVRLRFAQKEMARLGLPEHRSTALFVARRCLRLRHILGVLQQVRRRYEQYGTLPSQADLIVMSGRAGAPQPPDLEHILAVVASRYGCSSKHLCENTREKDLTLPRQIAMYLCRELLGESYPSLGLIFGGKDHSTIMYAVKKIGKMKVTNKDMHMLITELTKQCRNSTQRRDSGI